MASFWFWIFTILLSLIAGILLTMGFYVVINWFKDLIIKWRLPKDKKKLSAYIKEHPEEFGNTNPGRALELNKEEELKDERREATKFREFEKLRRAEIKGRTSEQRTDDRSSKGTEQLPGRELLPDGTSFGNSSDKSSPDPNRRRVKLDE